MFSSGYLSNMIMIQALEDEYEPLFLDEVSHSSVEDAARFSGKKVIRFRHLDAGHLEELLTGYTKPGYRPLVMTDGVFPARGEIPPLQDYTRLVEEYNGRVLIDDAHGMAVVGETGKGSPECTGADLRLILQVGTLSKGFGIFGGVIPGDRELIDKIQTKSLAWIGSTSTPLPLTAAAIKAIDVLQSNRRMITDLQNRSIELKKRFRDMGFDLPDSPAPIISLTLYDETKNRRLHDHLLDNGIFPCFIFYPGAPPGGHFRFALASSLEDSHLELLVETVATAL